jgi:IS30 family transposase
MLAQRVDQLPIHSHAISPLSVLQSRKDRLHKMFYTLAHPHAAWERGANENLNGLLRQFFPKHRRLEEVTDEKIALVQHRLNHRPRKCLGYKTPHQVFWEQLHSNHPVALRC